MQWLSSVGVRTFSLFFIPATPNSACSDARRPRISTAQQLLIGSVLSLALGVTLSQAGSGSGCVGATCSGPLVVPGVKGCVGMGCQPCDDKLLKELKAKRDLKVKTYTDIRKAAEETRQREGEALDEAKEIFGDYTKDIAKKGATTVAKKAYPVPSEVYAKYKKYKAMTGEVSSTEDVLKLAKFYLEELAKESGYKEAVERAKWVDTAISGIAMDAQMLTKLKEADFHSEQAFKQWLLGYEALTEARHLEDRIRKLEAQCKEKSAAPPPPEQEADERSSAERELEEAHRMVEGWRNVDGEIEKTQGSILLYDDAVKDALSIIQGQSSQWVPLQPMVASFEVGSSDMPVVQAVAANTYEAEWQRFRVPMRRAFEHLIQSVEAFVRVKTAFDRLGQDTGTPRSSQPLGNTPCIGMGCGTPPLTKGQQR